MSVEILIFYIYQIFNKHDKDSHDKINFESWKTVFTAERLVQSEKIQWSWHQIEEKDSVIKEKIEVIMKIQQELKSFHWKQLSSESKTHQNLKAHLFRDLFKQIKIDHLRSHAHMNFWSELEKNDSTTKDHQVLDYMWVYIYKFMKKRMLAKCKVWLVVQEDQQKSVFASIYAATLAACFFHVFMIMAAW